MKLQPKQITRLIGLARTPSAMAPLAADRLLVGALFSASDEVKPPSLNKTFVGTLRTEPAQPAEIDEEIFYPALSIGAGAH